MNDNSEEIETPQRTLSINIAALQGRYHVVLQQLLDSHAAIAAGLDLVDENAYSGFAPFFQAYPAQDRRLSKDLAVAEAQQRELRSVFRDAIELTHFLLEECWQVCVFFSAWNGGRITGADFNSIVGVGRSRFHKLNLPDKFNRLRNDYGVFTDLESHALSINRVRACLVHRLGYVSREDVDVNGELIANWRIIELVALNEDESETIIEESGFVVDEGQEIAVRITNGQKVFRIGEQISFSYKQINDTIFTLISLSNDLARAVEEYGKKRGVL